MDSKKNNMVLVEVIADYKDKEHAKLYLAADKERFEVTEKRAKELVAVGKVKIVKDEKTTSEVNEK